MNKFLFFIIVMITLAIGFTSCSKDESNFEPIQSIIESDFNIISAKQVTFEEYENTTNANTIKDDVSDSRRRLIPISQDLFICHIFDAVQDSNGNFEANLVTSNNSTLIVEFYCGTDLVFSDQHVVDFPFFIIHLKFGYELINYLEWDNCPAGQKRVDFTILKPNGQECEFVSVPMI